MIMSSVYPYQVLPQTVNWQTQPLLQKGWKEIMPVNNQGLYEASEIMEDFFSLFYLPI